MKSQPSSNDQSTKLEQFISLTKKLESTQTEAKIKQLEEELRNSKNECKHLETEFSDYKRKMEQKYELWKKESIESQLEKKKLENKLKLMEIMVKKYEEKLKEKE